MRCGLYGKIPSKRDFVSIAAPRHFLSYWEPWLANCLAASRAMLGEEAWKQAFCEAPVWRFHLDARLYGSGIFGVFTPSIDAVGRYFPLTLMTEGAPDGFIEPEADRCRIWFEAAEKFLLSVLDADLPRETIDAGLADLSAMNPDPPPDGDAATPILFMRLDDGAAGEETLTQIFSACREQAGTAAVLNYWWTLGHEAYRPRALVHKAMPNPFHFAAMLSEQAADPAQETSQSG